MCNLDQEKYTYMVARFTCDLSCPVVAVNSNQNSEQQLQ